jgi:hypothetical protein
MHIWEAMVYFLVFMGANKKSGMHCSNTFRFRSYTCVSGACRRGSTFPFLSVLLVELFDTTGRIKKLLLSRVERVAVLANFYVQIAHSRTGLKCVPTNTGNARFAIGGVDSRSHYHSLQLTLSPHEQRRRALIH